MQEKSITQRSRFLSTPFCRAIVWMLVFSQTFYGLPFNEIGSSYFWSPDNYRPNLERFIGLVSNAVAAASPTNPSSHEKEGDRRKKEGKEKEEDRDDEDQDKDSCRDKKKCPLVFGPKKYLRTNGAPNLYRDSFYGVSGEGTLRVKNGEDIGKCRVSSAIIEINGARLLFPNDFNQQRGYFETHVTLTEKNSIFLDLRSKPGSYLIVEIVQCTSINTNHPPVANAGPDQTIHPFQSVQLDGSASSDMDGDPLTFNWAFASIPSGSEATLSDPTAVNPSFIMDLPGTYVVGLIVNDNRVNSVLDTVTIGYQNSRPVANAGANQTVNAGDIVTLDGSNSTDVDGDQLTYWWSFSAKPAGSLADLTDLTTVRPSFTADKSGSYEIQLIVSDGIVDSNPASVTIATANSAPVANAGPDQTVHVNQTVAFDGSNSSDADGDSLVFWWSFTSKPAGSEATLSDPRAITPTFFIDRPGNYVAQLIVNDGKADSGADTVSISTLNSKPVANAGADQSVILGATVDLSGSDSTDADFDTLSYWWSFISKPADSSALLFGDSTDSRSFAPDKAGTYVVQLIVNDGTLDSNPDTVVIEVSQPVNNAPDAPSEAYTNNENTLLTVAAPGVLANDIDPEGNVLTATLESNVSNGALSFNGDGSFTYTANPNFYGIDSFSYKAYDGALYSAAATVTITVVQVTKPPVVTLDSVPDQTIPANVTLSLSLTGHSTDPLAALMYALTSGPAGASVTPMGVFTFTASQGQLGGPHPVTVEVQDGAGHSAQQMFEIRVVDHNHPPVLGALTDDVTTVGASYTKNLSATDPDIGDALTFTLLSGPAGMTIIGNQIVWTPIGEQLGNWPVQVQVADRAGASDSGLFHVGLPLVKANDDNYEVEIGQTLNVTAPGVLGNDEDPSGAGLTAAKLTDPGKGTLSAFNADGSFTYEAPTVIDKTFEPAVKWIKHSGIGAAGYWMRNLRSVDVDSDGKPEIILLDNNPARVLVIRGTDGTTLWESPLSLPAGSEQCTIMTAGMYDDVAVGDIDDSGTPAIIVPVTCTYTNRLAAIDGRTGALKWLSPKLSSPGAGGYEYPMVFGVTPAIARLRPSETPSVIFKRSVASWDSSGKYSCEQSQAGLSGYCSVVFALDGASGQIRQTWVAAGDGYVEMGGREAYGHVIVSDLAGSGSPNIISDRAVWDVNGNLLNYRADGGKVLSLALANLDDSGETAIVSHELAQNYGYVVARKPDGTVMWKTPTVAAYYAQYGGQLIVANLFGDGRPKVLVVTSSATTSGNILVYDEHGALVWTHRFADAANNSTVEPYKRPVVFDLDGDGVPEVIMQTTYGIEFLDGKTGTVKANMSYVDMGYPLSPYTYSSRMTPIVIDGDADGHAEVLFPIPSIMYGLESWIVALRSHNNDWQPARPVWNQYGMHDANVSDNGHIPQVEVNNFAVPRTNVFANPARIAPDVDPRKHEQAKFTYQAAAGASTSNPATVTIDIVPPNRPPVFTSTPPNTFISYNASYPAIVPFLYESHAVDPDPGDTITYSIFNRASFWGNQADGFTIDPATGKFECKPLIIGSNNGPLMFIIAATDSFGATAYQTFTLSPSTGFATVPDVVGLDKAIADAALKAAGFDTGAVTEVSSSDPAGLVLSQVPSAGTRLLTGEMIAVTVSLGPPVILPPVAPGPPPQLGNLARIVVEPTSALKVAGEAIPFKAVGVYNDGTGADITASVVWSSSLPSVATINATGAARAVAEGTTVITATAGGLSGLANFTVVSRTPGDSITPTAIITAPADGGTVAGLTQIIGTANDANFLRYEIAVAPADETSWTLVGQGTAPVTNGTLGTFDPTMLLNDLYTLRLTVFDRNGNETVASATVQVAGGQKPGLFTLMYQDINLPAAGMPVAVTRTYDSRDKAKGDFGIGWRLGFQTLRLRTNRVPGTGWVRNISGARVGLVPTSEHKVSLTLPDGKVEEFDLVLSPTSGFGGLDATAVTGYAPRPGTLGKLEMLDNPNLLILNGATEDELVDDMTLNTFEPVHYRYTSLDGTQIEIHRKEGVKKVTDKNANSITFGAGGIIHSSGKSVVFTRDGQGRITQITDPLGNVQTYAYDSNGDLISHTTATGDVSRYAYDYYHNLIDIQDPAGNHAARNDYDEAGRLIATTDAKGNQIRFTHNLAASREVVTDRLGNPTIFDYDAAGNVTTKTDALGHATTYTYDSRNNQLTETDPLGRVASKTYDSKNNVLTSTDFDGNTTSSTYDANGQELTRTDPEGRTTANVYDSNGNLTQTTDPEGGITRNTYDAAGNRLTTTDPLGHVTTFTFDPAGNKTSQADPLGNVTTYSYDASGNRIAEIDPAGKSTQYVYDASGRLIRTTGKLGQITSVTYSALGDGQKIASRTDPKGNVTRFDYDTLGNLIGTTNPDGSSAAVTYDLGNHLLSQTDHDGHLTSFQYDALGRQIKIIHPDGAISLKSYDAAGRVQTQTDERGNTTTYGYAANQQTVTDGSGHVTKYVFDSQHRRIQITDALGHVTRFNYDSAGNVVKITFPDGTSKTTAYDAAKRKTKEIDQAGQSAQFSYDALGRLIRVIDALGGTTTYTYDALGNRLNQTDANGHTTTMSYDALGRLLRRTRPLGQQETFAYDANGNNVSYTDFNGQTATFTYDAANRLTQKSLPDASTVAYAYTGAGLRAQAGGDSYTYDSRGRLIEEHKSTGETLSYTYDAAGNKTAVTTPQGTTAYTYDALNRLASVTDSAGITTYGYDAIGNLTSAAYPNGVNATYSYDSLNRLLQVANNGPGGLISSYAYTLGPAGNRMQVVEAGAATTGRRVSYTFDALYRLIQEQIDEPGTLSDQTIAYAYDPAGNRTQMTRNSAVTNYIYDANDRLLTEVNNSGTTTSTYDDNGNLKSRVSSAGTETYTYDGENRLVSAINASGSVSYTYDADGMRTSKTAGGVTTNFLLDKNREYAQVLVETAGASVVTYTYGNQLINQTRPGTGTHYYLSDGQLSTRQLADSAGIVTDQYTYDAFGVMLASAGVTPNTYLYTGEQYDPNMGFYYLRARYYDQVRGRFITTDPELGNSFDPVSLHRYLYANANPVDNRDPSGRESLLSVMGAIGLMAGVIGVFARAYKRGHFVLNWQEAKSFVADFGKGALLGAFAFGEIGLMGLAFGTFTVNSMADVMKKHYEGDMTLADLLSIFQVQFVLTGAALLLDVTVGPLAGEAAAAVADDFVFELLLDPWQDMLGKWGAELGYSTMIWKQNDYFPAFVESFKGLAKNFMSWFDGNKQKYPKAKPKPRAKRR